MTRRRFFPSTKVQQEPAQSVELAVQLQPEAEATVTEVAQDCPDACVCDVVGPALLIDAREPRYSGLLMRTTYEDWRLTAASCEIWTGGNATFRAVVAGYPACEITWDWDLSVPTLPGDGYYESYWLGVEVVEQDGTLRIAVLEGALHWALGYSALWEATLTLNAYCSGELVGTIVLKPSFNILAGGYGGGGSYDYGY